MRFQFVCYFFNAILLPYTVSVPDDQSKTACNPRNDPPAPDMKLDRFDMPETMLLDLYLGVYIAVL